MFSNKEIERYYELAEVHYRRFWNLEKSKSFHYGYWDESTKNFHEALLNINKILAKLAGVSSDSHVLDAGCGIGGSCLWLASHAGCRVTGITLSEHQVRKAKILAEKEGVSGLVNFEKGDYTSTFFRDRSFDVVWAIESVCYARNKIDFIKEAFRVLKRGGRLVIADFFKKHGLEGKDAGMVEKLTHGWAINDFSTIEDFQNDLNSEGFKKIQIQDASKAILPSARKLYRAYFLGVIGAFLYKVVKKPSSLSENNVGTAYWQYKTLKKDLWRYQIILAEKE